MSTEVVVIGGGYAGVVAANRLRKRDDVTVTLVNPRGTFVERIRLHQLAAGTDDAVVDYADVLGTGVRLVVDTVARIDAAGRSVELASGDRLHYDYLIYAVGSRSPESRVPGVAEFGYPVDSLEQAHRLRAVLDATDRSAPVTVVGGGPTGIETAAELGEAGRRVTLVCGGVLGPYLHGKGRRAVAKRLARLGVTVLEGAGATVAAVTSDTVTLADGRELPSAVTIWAAGFGVPDLARRSGLATDAAGRLLTDETLTSVDDERIVAAGDAAAPSDQPMRMSCQAALPLGAQAAETVLSRLAAAEPKPVSLGFVGQCLSLGRRSGLVQLAGKDDVARGFYVGGRLSAVVKETVCKQTVSALVKEARRPGSLSWFTDRSRQRRMADQQELVDRQDVVPQPGAGRVTETAQR
ncbi:NAD(P)/FAD-dependent oxidoreductase [Plantactinospora sp. WMMB782]|uniref:NAD(P)/FAD-dependent oxidoreductase n=1 Tax=Plantactinospora sp. WMMB782 TaxID=3404121 RepID=UPI003B933241